MSSLLRSTKFVRYFCGAARTLILNSARNVETNVLLRNRALGAANNLMVRDYATEKNTDSLGPLLENMDFEIRRYGSISKRNLDELLDGIKLTKNINSSQALLVIRCCGDILSEELPEKRTQLVQKIWSVLSDIGVQMDISHYNTLLRVYIENEHPFSPAEFLEDLTVKGLQPNHVTYQRLMWRYCQQGDIDGATQVLENMRELGHPITVPVLNALILGHSTIGDTDGAKSVLNTVAGAGLQATNHTYALLACGFAKKGDVEGTKEVLTMANEGENFLTNKDIFSILEAFAVNGHGDKIDFLFEHFEQGLNYRHDSHNAILHLINKGQADVAKKILKTYMKPIAADEEQRFYRGGFFVKQLLKSNISSAAIIETCKELQEEGYVPNALVIALEASLHQGHTELAQLLMKDLNNSGVAIRQHYYWPLLVQKGKEGDEEGMLQILRNMSVQAVTPSRETLQNYVLPYLKSNANDVIVKLQLANIPTTLAVRCVANSLLQYLKIQEAAEVISQFNVRGNVIVADYLVNALIKTKDFTAFPKILQSMAAKSDTTNDTEEDDVSTDRNDVNAIILRAATALKTPELIEKLLTNILPKGIALSANTASSIEEFLGQNLTPALSDILSKLTADDLELSPIKRPAVMRTVAETESYITSLREKGLEVKGLQKQLLNLYMKDNDTAKVEELVKQLEADNEFTVTSATYSQLIEFYLENNDIDRALHYRDVLIQQFPEYKIHNLRLMQIAHGFIKAKRFDEAMALFRNTTSDGSDYFKYNTKCWQVLNELAEQKDPAKLKELFNILIDNKFIEATNVLLGPLIRVHLVCDDLNGALNQFEQCCKLYRSTPWKGELMKRLIVDEDATKLQWLADLSTQIHGEVNVLYDLILAFIECGRLRQARRILQTPGLHTRNQRLSDACKRYANDGQTECIEGLLEATKELSHIDRAKIFYHLLTSYVNASETDKALGLWNHLQEEGEVPSEAFLSLLGQHLKEKNREVPFVLPTNEKPKSVETVKIENSRQVDTLLESGKTNEAFDLALKCLKDGGTIRRKSLSYLLKILTEEANVTKLMLLKPYFEDKGKQYNIHHKVTLANVVSGTGGSVIDEIYTGIQNGEPVEKLVVAFPKADALNIILKDENLAQKCEEIARIFATKEEILPVNVMWMEYLINGQESKAAALWQQYLKDESFIKFKRLLHYSYIENKPQLMRTLITCLDGNSKITPEAKGNVYSRLILLHVSNKEVEMGKAVFEEALSKGLTIYNFNKSALKKLRLACQNSDIPFKYEIPSDIK